MIKLIIFVRITGDIFLAFNLKFRILSSFIVTSSRSRHQAFKLRMSIEKAASSANKSKSARHSTPRYDAQDREEEKSVDATFTGPFNVLHRIPLRPTLLRCPQCLKVNITRMMELDAVDIKVQKELLWRLTSSFHDG